MPIFTNRVNALILVSEVVVTDEETHDAVVKLRQLSDVMDIMSNPTNPGLENAYGDARPSFYQFEWKLANLVVKVLNDVASAYGREHSEALGPMINNGEVEKVEAYVTETLPLGSKKSANPKL